MKKITLSLLITLSLCQGKTYAQGIWTPLVHKTPVVNGGVMVMLLLSDGTVMAKTDSCGSDTSATSTWAKLAPDINGSYVNGTWTTITPMHDTRVYFASRVLKNGNVFVAGGEIENESPTGNGTGGATGETYNPLTGIWTKATAQSSYFGDANSELLPDGRVLVGIVANPGKGTKIFDPATNNWTAGPTAINSHDESAWLKLPDNSVLFVDIGKKTSERYIPSLNQWVADATVSDSLYDPYYYESGASFMLPDGRAFFLGSTGHTAYYTPSGNTSPGTWANGPDFPNGYGTVDAPGAMMVNGKILCAASPKNTSTSIALSFRAPTKFFEFNYLTNSFSPVFAPGGSDSINIPCYMTNMLDLPDGTVLFSMQNSSQCYVYKPSGAPLAAGKPTIGSMVPLNCDTLRLTGTLFNGISEGAAYGDDWQMASNYPIVRLTRGANVYYARTFNWNSTGLQRGSAPDTTLFTLPAGLPFGSYALVVIANGISSDTVNYVHPSCPLGINTLTQANRFNVYPNPATKQFTIETDLEDKYTVELSDASGRCVLSTIAAGNATVDISDLNEGVYTLTLKTAGNIINKKLIVLRR